MLVVLSTFPKLLITKKHTWVSKGNLNMFKSHDDEKYPLKIQITVPSENTETG